MSYNSCGSGKGISRDEDFISRCHSQGIQAELKCRRTGIYSERITTSNIGCKFTLKLLSHWTGSEPSRLKHLRDCFQFSWSDAGSMERNELVRHGFVADGSGRWL